MKTKLFFGTLMLMGIMFSQCKREGCTNSNSENYCSKCKSSPDMCVYKGKLNFWYSKSAGEKMWYDGIDYLKIYVDEQLIGTSNVLTDYCVSSSDAKCNGSCGISATKEWSGGSTSKNSVSYKVYDDLGFLIKSGTAYFSGDKCNDERIYY